LFAAKQDVRRRRDHGRRPPRRRGCGGAAITR
jgi:hypothetical protein